MMYNELQKLAYINSNDTFTEKVKQDILTIFQKISKTEEEIGTDICNVNPADYPKIIFETIDIQRYSYFKETFNKLMKYRTYCFDTNKIDKVYFYANADKFVGNISMNDLYESFKKNMILYNSSMLITTPDDLYMILSNKLYQGSSIVVTSGNAYIDRKTVSLDELTTLFIMMQFFGIDKCKSCFVNRNKIIIDSNKQYASIILEDKKYEIIGKCVELLEKCKDARFVSFHGSTKQLSYECLLAFDSDKTNEEKIRRGTKYYNKFAKDCTKVDYNIPTTSNIKFAGDIYRMCVVSKRNSIRCETNEDILKLHSVITEKPLRKKQCIYPAQIEIIKRYKETFSNLEENELWPY